MNLNQPLLSPFCTLPKTQILIRTHIRFMFSEHSQQEVVIDTSKIKNASLPFFHSCICMCELPSFQLFCGQAQGLAIQLQCEFLCMCVGKAERKR